MADKRVTSCDFVVRERKVTQNSWSGPTSAHRLGLHRSLRQWIKGVIVRESCFRVTKCLFVKDNAPVPFTVNANDGSVLKRSHFTLPAIVWLYGLLLLVRHKAVRVRRTAGPSFCTVVIVDGLHATRLNLLQYVPVIVVGIRNDFGQGRLFGWGLELNRDGLKKLKLSRLIVNGWVIQTVILICSGPCDRLITIQLFGQELLVKLIVGFSNFLVPTLNRWGVLVVPINVNEVISIVLPLGTVVAPEIKVITVREIRRDRVAIGQHLCVRWNGRHGWNGSTCREA